MAGDWIPRQKGLSKKPEVLAIARATGKDRRWVADALMDFWEWCDSESLDGRLNVCLADLPALIEGTDMVFWTAVVSADWLREQASGIAVPNFGRWLGHSAKKRLQDSERKKRVRLQSGQIEDKNGTPVLSSSVLSSSVSAVSSSGVKEGDARGNHRGGGAHAELPECLRTPAFERAWGEWIAYRRETRKPLKPMTEAKQLAKLAAMDVALAIRSVEQSICNGWQGLFQPREEESGSSQPRSGNAGSTKSPGRVANRYYADQDHPRLASTDAEDTTVG